MFVVCKIYGCLRDFYFLYQLYLVHIWLFACLRFYSNNPSFVIISFNWFRQQEMNLDCILGLHDQAMDKTQVLFVLLTHYNFKFEFKFFEVNFKMVMVIVYVLICDWIPLHSLLIKNYQVSMRRPNVAMFENEL